MTTTIEKMNFAPRARSLKAEHRKDVGWAKALRELIDNSLDAGASEVEIEIDTQRQFFAIRDNGRGCENLERILALGERMDHEETESGFHGVGGKMALLYFWGVTQITSVCDGIKRCTVVDWEQVHRDNCADGQVAIEPTDQNNGTEIICESIQRKQLQAARLIESLTNDFWPAVQCGKRISLRIGSFEQVIDDEREPEWSKDPLDIEGEVHGLRFRVVAGLVNGNNPDAGFTLVKAHRIVKRGFNDACGDYNVSAFHGRVFLLDREWELTTTKDGIANEDIRDDLSAQLAEICSELLRQGDSVSTDMTLEKIGEELELGLFSRQYRHRQKTTHPQTGTIKPKHTGAKRNAKKIEGDLHTEQEREQGSSLSAKAGRILVQGVTNIGTRLGKVERREHNKKRTYVIQLNSNRPDVAACYKNGIQTETCKVLCAALLANHLTDNKDEEQTKQMVLSGIEDHGGRETFYNIMGRWFPNVISMERRAQ